MSSTQPRRLVLLGHPVSHSLSPVFQQAALDYHRIPLRYQAVDVTSADLPALIGELRGQRAAGNVTLPHKTAVSAMCTSRGALAARSNAVNTFWCDSDGSLQGRNTDVGGFLFAAKRLLGRDLHGLRAVILGAGGAAAGVVEALCDVRDASLTVHARNPVAANELLTTIGVRGGATDGTEQSLVEALATADLVVNATPLGIEGQDMLPVAPQLIPPQCAALDLTYRRSGFTPWVRALQELNRNADDGIGMLLEQGALSFEHWFGIDAPRAVMADAIRR